MAADIKSAQDVSFSLQGNGWTRVRHKIVNGENWQELFSSNVFPAYGSRHPDDSTFALESANVTQIGNENGKIQVLWEGTYQQTTGGGGSSSGGEVQPWDLGAQNISITAASETKPMLGGYNENGNYVSLRNTAGCPIFAEETKTITELSFTFCIKAGSSGGPNRNTVPLINKSSCTVAGYTIDAKCGLLMPLGAKLIVEYEEDDPGKVKRRYWEVSATIRINSSGWQREFLNVGTMAKFGDSSGSDPQPIYTFKAGETGQVKYGSIFAAIAARTAYLKTNPDAKDFSYAEITEPLPLNNSGGIDFDAMRGGTNSYKKIVMYETKPTSWSSFNLPKDRG